ncbi:MAG TPA: recombinase family protein [Candidatus Brocadiia bacterium]|nr:recombinase family protein [Candidatus Brocadiales bacterium]
MKKFFGYIRVSTIKQGEQGVSLNEQRDAISSYSQRHGLTITEWFEEKETAAKRGRPVFNQMMRLLRQGRADGVIIHKIDRSARNLKDWADLGELIDRKIEVHFANENLDMHSRGGRLSADIQAVVAADFIRNLKEETRKGFYGRIKQGLYPLPAPLGYLDMGKGKPKEPDPAKAPLVRKAFELYGTGKYTLESLANEMYFLGLRNRNEKKVSISGLSVVLNNPFYIGLIKLKSTGETFLGVHKAIISKTLFDRVRRILNGKLNARTQKHNFLFCRLIVCKYCGYSLIGETQKGNTYYRCHTKQCPTSCFREEAIEDKILKKFATIQFHEQEIAYMRNKVAQLKDDWETKQKEQINVLELNLSHLKVRINNLTDAYIDRLIEKEVFEERKDSLLMEKRALEEKLAEIKEKAKSVPDKLSKFLELAGSVYLSYKMGITEEKRDLLKTVTSNRLVDGKNIEIALNLPFQEVANRHEIPNGAPYRYRPRTGLNMLFDRLVQHFSLSIEN